MADERRSLGSRGEALVADRLVAAGWRIRALNWRCRLGEIDIVAQDGDCLVLVEVRTRRGERFGAPEESVGRAKQERLARLAAAYVQAEDWQGPWRIDVVAVTLQPDGSVSRMAHYANAVEGLA